MKRMKFGPHKLKNFYLLANLLPRRYCSLHDSPPPPLPHPKVSCSHFAVTVPTLSDLQWLWPPYLSSEASESAPSAAKPTLWVTADTNHTCSLGSQPHMFTPTHESDTRLTPHLETCTYNMVAWFCDPGVLIECIDHRQCVLCVCCAHCHGNSLLPPSLLRCVGAWELISQLILLPWVYKETTASVLQIQAKMSCDNIGGLKCILYFCCFAFRFWIKQPDNGTNIVQE